MKQSSNKKEKKMLVKLVRIHQRDIHELYLDILFICSYFSGSIRTNCFNFNISQDKLGAPVVKLLVRESSQLQLSFLFYQMSPKSQLSFVFDYQVRSLNLQRISILNQLDLLSVLYRKHMMWPNSYVNRSSTPTRHQTKSVSKCNYVIFDS